MGDFFVFSVFVLLGFYFLREYMYYMMNVSKLKKKMQTTHKGPSGNLVCGIGPTAPAEVFPLQGSSF